MLTLSWAIDQINFTIPVHDPMLAAIAGGAILGTGAGITLHSLGSSGGNDVIAVLLNQKFNIRMGTFFFGFNLEEIVFDLDPDAFVTIERTFNVLGRGFSHRKIY
ncbi:MAG: YitT family protein [Deltaproteobacteria bacterium]|nr:YitT family protein [Deltaproteobacteria bacterium]